MINSDTESDKNISKFLSLISKFRTFLTPIRSTRGVNTDLMVLDAVESEAKTDMSKLPYLQLVLIVLANKYDGLVSMLR